MNKVTIDLPVESVERIIIDDLKRHYKYCIEAIDDLESKDSLHRGQVGDLIDNKELKPAFERILKYYTTVDEYDLFMEEIWLRKVADGKCHD